MVTVRRFRDSDAPLLWALNALPNIGETADPTVPLPLPRAAAPPANFADLADIDASFLAVGGEFLVAELDGNVVGMGGFRPDAGARAEVLRVRVHPATRRRGVGRALMAELERCAERAGMRQMHLDTATNQPEAMAFYRGLGYAEVGRERQPEWSWTLVYYVKPLNSTLEISHDVGSVQLPQVMKLWASAWWAAGRTEDQTRRILAGSDVVVTVTDRPSGRVVGFARVLTDQTYLAVILDVIVAPDFRGSGVGAMLMDAVLGHPQVADVTSIELVCRPELISFYRRWGFTDQVGGSRLMRRTADPALIPES